ncbi:MAG TPA: S41 family peptidase [Thermoanaerobaculia bacterium]|nr:S41 family peptidase [Thermoanaerobaculia bacterium]
MRQSRNARDPGGPATRHSRGGLPSAGPAAGRAARGAAVVLACGLLAAGFTLDRPRHTDLSSLGWNAAFSRLCTLLASEYPFTAWKGIDWTAIERELGPRVAAAETRRDRRGYYRALRELVWRLRDGHARLVGDDGGLERAEAGGSFGFEVVELDDGRVLASRVVAGGPAERAGLRAGAEVLRWNGAPAGAALAAVPVLWSERPPATREGNRLTQASLLTRAPVGARAAIVFRGTAATDGAAKDGSSAAGASHEVIRELVAAAAPPARAPCLRAAALLAGRTLETRELAAGAGYVRLNFELPTLRTPLPGWALHRALAHFAADRLPGVVVDVRGNCGGMDAMVPQLVAPLLREATLYEIPGVYLRELRQFRGFRELRERREGPELGRFEPDPRQAIAVLPRPPLYRGRIAVLVDADTVSAGEAIPLLLKGQPGTAVIGLHATHGSFGIGLKSVTLPGGLEVIFPHAQSLDGDGRVEVDGDATGRGGVEPDVRLPLSAAVADRLYRRGEDVVLDAGVRFVRGYPPGSPAPPRAPGPPGG